MKCPKCGFDNYDGILECSNCHTQLKRENVENITNEDTTNLNYQKTNFSEPYIQNHIQNQPENIQPPMYEEETPIRVIKTEIYEPKKKKDKGPLFTTLFLIALVGVTGFCGWAYFSNQKALNEKQQLALNNANNINNAQEEIDELTEQANIDIDFSGDYINNSSEQQQNNHNTNISENIDNPMPTITYTDKEKLLMDLNMLSDYKIYSGNTQTSIRIPSENESVISPIYEKDAKKFWSNTIIAIFNGNYTNTSSVDRAIHNAFVSKYVNDWGFANKYSNMQTTSYNGQFAYYVDGYNATKNIYARCLFVLEAKAKLGNDGTYVPETELPKNGSFTIIEITYNQDDASKVMQLIQLATQESTTKNHEISLSDLAQQEQQSYLDKETDYQKRLEEWKNNTKSTNNETINNTPNENNSSWKENTTNTQNANGNNSNSSSSNVSSGAVIDNNGMDFSGLYNSNNNGNTTIEDNYNLGELSGPKSDRDSLDKTIQY